VLSNTGTVRAVHADSMDFIEESDSSVLLCEIANLFDGTNGTTHAVDTLKSDNLRSLCRKRGQLLLKIGHVVVLENHLLGTRVTDTLNHGSVVAAVRQNNAIGEL